MSLLTCLKLLFSSSRLFVHKLRLIGHSSNTLDHRLPLVRSKGGNLNGKGYQALCQARLWENAADGVLGSSVFRYHYSTMEQVSHTMAVIGVRSGTEDLGQSVEYTNVHSGNLFFRWRH